MSSTDATDYLRDELRRRLAALGVSSGAIVMAACSGGPDSTALLDALVAWAHENGARVLCAYLDHGIRGESERALERQTVAALAQRLEVPLLSGSLPSGLLAASSRREGEGLEDAARRARYRFLAEAARTNRADVLATGHTADDVAETVLMRVCQGVDLSGLGGIPERRGRIIRPLIRLSREDVLRYLDARGLGYVSDSSNAERRFLRNRIRSEVLPAVARVFPSYRTSLLELARKAGAAWSFVERSARERIPWSRVGESERTPWRAFVEADGLLRVTAVYSALDRLGAGRVPSRFLEPLRGELDVRKRGTLVSGGGFRIARRGEALVVDRDVVLPGKIGYLVCIRAPGGHVLPEIGMTVVATLPGGAVAPPRDEAGAGTVVLRSRRPGDRVLRAGRWQSLERLERGWGFETERAELVPIVESRDGIQRVLGSFVGGTDVEADRPGRGASTVPVITVTAAVEE